jgi:DNA polymerase-3 subunit beta
MEIRIDRNELLKTVSKVQSIIERRSNMPILTTVLLKTTPTGLSVTATDLEIGFEQIVPANVLREGTITVSGRKLFEILRESKGPNFVIREKEKNWIFMTDETARFNLASMPSEDYPSFVEPEGVSSMSVPGEILTEMINKTIYAVTMEEAGFKLSGVFVEKVMQEGRTSLRMVATDGHRLSMIDKDLKGVETLDLGSGVMIPKKGMNELTKMASEGGEVIFGFKQNTCVAKRDATLLVVRLLDTKFPDYHAVIPKRIKTHVLVKRMVLLEAMRKMLILSNDRYRAVKLTLDQGMIQLLSTNPELGDAQEDIPVTYQEERLEMGFNSRYFVDTLQVMESEEISLGFIDGSKPCVLEGDGDKGFLGLIMPMRL